MSQPFYLNLPKVRLALSPELRVSFPIYRAVMAADAALRCGALYLDDDEQFTIPIQHGNPSGLPRFFQVEAAHDCAVFQLDA
jgi:hypothetical protein